MWYYGKSNGRYLPGFTKARVGLGYNPKVRLFTVRETAVVLRHRPEWVLVQIRAGRMSAVRFGKEYFIHSFELNRWMGNSPRGSKPFQTLNKGKRHAKAKETPEAD